MKNKIFLSIETSLNRIFITLYNRGSLFSIEKTVHSSIEVDLNLLIKDILDKHQTKFRDLDFILVSLGPGSYTGTRIGIAAAKAIALSIKKPLMGFSNFDALLIQHQLEKCNSIYNELGIVIKANKNELYYQKVDGFKRGLMEVIQIKVLQKKNTYPKIIIGNLRESFNFNKYYYCLPSEKVALKLFQALYKNYKEGSRQFIDPYYIAGHYAEK